MDNSRDIQESDLPNLKLYDISVQTALKSFKEFSAEQSAAPASNHYVFIRRGFFTGAAGHTSYPVESPDPDGEFLRRFPRPITVTVEEDHYELQPAICCCIVYADYFVGDADSPNKQNATTY